MASRSLLKASARLRRVASELRPNAALIEDATEVEACSSFSRNLSSSASVMGAALMRSKISSRNCASRSLPLQMLSVVPPEAVLRHLLLLLDGRIM